MVMITNISRLQKRLDTNQESELPNSYIALIRTPIIFQIFGEYLLL